MLIRDFSEVAVLVHFGLKLNPTFNQSVISLNDIPRNLVLSVGYYQESRHETFGSKLSTWLLGIINPFFIYICQQQKPWTSKLSG